MAVEHSTEHSIPTLDLAAYSSRQKSPVWKYFGIEKNSSGAAERDKCVTCKLCGQKVAHGGGTTNLKNHLQTNHRKEYDELFENESSLPSTIDSFVRSSGSKKLPQNSPRAVELTNAVVEFISRDLRPVNVVDGTGFLSLMNVAESHFVVPCRRTVMNHIDWKYCEMKRAV